MKSPYLWKKGEGYNLLKEMGIRHQGRSDTVERALSDFGIEESFGQAAKRFEEHYRYDCSASCVHRVTKRIAEEAEEYVAGKLEEAEQSYSEGKSGSAEKILAEPDGSELRTAVTERIKDTSGKIRMRKEVKWHEVRVGFAGHLGSVSKKYICKMGSYPDVVRDLSDVSVLSGMGSETEIIGIADGGIGLKEESESRFPNIQFISDKTHLKDHLYETAEAIGIKEHERKKWVENRLETVSSGKSEEVRKESEEYSRKYPNKRMKRLIGYLKRFSESMNYEEFGEKGYPAGSREVESAHKSIPQKRMKIHGACRRKNSLIQCLL